MVPSGATEKKFPVTPPGIDPRTSRLVAQRLNHYATPGTNDKINIIRKQETVYIPKNVKILWTAFTAAGNVATG